VAVLIWWAAATSTTPTSDAAVRPASHEAASSVRPRQRPASAPQLVPILPRLQLQPEQKPPVGTEHEHSAAELRYCFSEKVRLDAGRDVVTTATAIKRFNSMVDDYNGRCGRYQYLEAERDQVQRQVQAKESALRSEGVARFRP
jgi:hypothetical protein